jgi:hypothetical protein
MNSPVDGELRNEALALGGGSPVCLWRWRGNGVAWITQPDPITAARGGRPFAGRTLAVWTLRWWP